MGDFSVSLDTKTGKTDNYKKYKQYLAEGFSAAYQRLKSGDVFSGEGLFTYMRNQGVQQYDGNQGVGAFNS